MGAGTWTQSLDYDAPCDGYLYIGVGKDEDSTILGWVSPGISEGSHSITPAISGDSMEFDTGEHLMLALKWYPVSGSPDLVVTFGSGTKLASPSTDPGYPVPELSSLILFSVGLLALAGYVVYRRRK
jgi:hypothetical protein